MRATSGWPTKDSTVSLPSPSGYAAAGSASAPATRPYLKMGFTRIPPPSETPFRSS